MSLAGPPPVLTSADEYLAAEATAPQRREFLNGVVYAMAGGTLLHGAICANILAAIHGQLRGTSCRAYGSDLLLQVQAGEDVRFYYPDVTLYCGDSALDRRFISEPTVLFEVLSESTARIDTGEKRMAYLTIPSLEAYVIVESERRAVTVWRRSGNGWGVERISEEGAVFSIPEIPCSLGLAEVYAGLKVPLAS